MPELINNDPVSSNNCALLPISQRRINETIVKSEKINLGNRLIKPAEMTI